MYNTLMPPLELETTVTSGAAVEVLGERHWQLSIPAGEPGNYRLAQLDDYRPYRRRDLPWKPPLSMTLRARASASQLPGTWGFGLWNDPFSLALGFGGGARRLPALPNAAWFFFASEQNHLALRDDLPGSGALAATFCSPAVPSLLLGLGLPALPLLALRPSARGLRRLASKIIQQDATVLQIEPGEWHKYRLEWRPGEVSFVVDEKEALRTPLAPRGPLGLVLWIDNQYAAFPPDGRPRYGFQANAEPAWIEIADLQLD